MLPEAHYYRDPSFLYPLRSHPTYWFHAGRGEAIQVIMGLLGTEFCTIVFDHSGDLIEVQKQPLMVRSSSQRSDDLNLLYGLVEEEVVQVRKAFGLADETIHVRRFRLPVLQAGIDDMPDELLEYIAKREASLVREEDLDEAVEGWREEESLFVFWWGQSLYVDGHGYVTSS